jgi:ER membrane protein complex subunit 7
VSFYPFAARVEVFSLTRKTVSVLSIFKNPVILMSLVSMGLFFGMPKLVEQSKSPLEMEYSKSSKGY